MTMWELHLENETDAVAYTLINYDKNCCYR